MSFGLATSKRSVFITVLAGMQKAEYLGIGELSPEYVADAADGRVILLEICMCVLSKSNNHHAAEIDLCVAQTLDDLLCEFRREILEIQPQLRDGTDDLQHFVKTHNLQISRRNLISTAPMETSLLQYRGVGDIGNADIPVHQPLQVFIVAHHDYSILRGLEVELDDVARSGNGIRICGTRRFRSPAASVAEAAVRNHERLGDRFEILGIVVCPPRLLHGETPVLVFEHMDAAVLLERLLRRIGSAFAGELTDKGLENERMGHAENLVHFTVKRANRLIEK